MLNKQATYKRNIEKHLYFNGELSCADLCDLTKKSLPLTVRVLNELIEDGVVIEKGFANSTGGRRPQMYTLNKELKYVVSVAMDQLITRIAMLDMHNNYVGEVKKMELVLTNNPNSLDQLTLLIDEFINESGIPKSRIVGIGIGMPGFVDVKKGINHSFLFTDSKHSIVNVIETQIGIPVYIDNDSSLIALAELRFGAARNKQNVMVINIGWGIGLGIVIDGELFRGENGFAGEFSHMSLFTNNKMCGCGKTGCLETEASLLVVVQKAIDGINEGKSTLLKNISLDNIEESSRRILDAAVKGDKFAVELLSQTGYIIGKGIAILIHLLNPKLIVLSGRGLIAGKLWLAPIQQSINENCIPKIAENTEIEISTLDYQAELIGAAALVMDQYDKFSIIKKSVTEKQLM